MKINFWYNYDSFFIEIYPKTGDLKLDSNSNIEEIPDELYERYMKALKEYKEVQEELEQLNNEYHTKSSHKSRPSDEEISEEHFNKSLNEWWSNLKTFLVGDKK